MATRWYRAGTITVTNGSRDVVGANTKWVDDSAKPLAGDALIIDSQIHEIEVITDNNNLKLFKPFSGNTASGVSYAIIRNASINISSRLAAAVSAAINSKQLYLDELNEFFTSNAPTMVMHDSVGDAKTVIPYNSLKTNIVNLVKDASSIAILVKQAVDSKTAVESAKNEVSKWRDEIIVIEDKIKKDKKHIDSVKGEVDTVKGEVDTIKGQVDKVQSDVTTKKNEIDKLHTDSEKLRDEAVKAAQLAQAAVVPMRNEAEMWEMIRRNKDLYAASQFVHFGTHVNSSAWGHANEGMFVDSTSSSSSARGKILMGEISNPAGSSKTNFPVTMVAGFISKLLGLTDQVGFNSAQILLPEAPDGTVIYDSTGSARGTGKANLDLSVDVDPLYGDVAQSHNEAVARAFGGGIIKNADFRNGTAEWNASLVSVNDGIATISGNNNNAGLGSNLNIDLFAGTEYVVEIVCTRYGGTGALTLTNNGLRHRAISVNGVGTFRSRFTAESSDPSYFFWLLNCDLDIASIRVYRASEQVVIAPHDVFGMEYWLEEVSQAKPDVFDCGMVQSKATSSNGVATSASSRPQTYHAAFKGDTTTGQKSVNFFTATFEQQCKLAAKEGNNLFRLNDGRIVQYRGRQKTFRGQGNGDWLNINPTYQNSTTGLYLQYASGAQYLAPQGALDSADDFNSTNPTYRCSGESVTSSQNPNPQTGVFSLFDNSQSELIAVADLCYMQIWGEVPRLNQGAYHPSFNHMGARNFTKIGYETDLVHGRSWWQSDANKPTSPAKCFGSFYVNSLSGYMGAPRGSGRDDGRFYDQPYSEGQGGIIDRRVSAHDMGSKEEAAKVFQKVVNGTYRGKEKLIKTRVFGGVVPQDKGTFSGYAQVRFPAGTIESSFPQYQKATDVKVGGHFVDASNNIFVISAISANPGGFDTVYLSTQLGNHSNNIDITGICYIMPIEELNSSVSGEFTMMDVVGDPAEILKTPDLANGWLGGWISVIPDGSPKHFPYTKHNIGKVGDGTDAFATTTHGKAWGESSVNTDTNADNIFGASNQSISAAHVYVIPYIAFAKQTKESKNNPILNNSDGLGYVWASADNYLVQGNGLLESLLGKVGRDNKDGNQERRLNLTRHFFLPEGKLKDGANLQLHEPIDLWEPRNNSPAVKTLWSQTSNNQQATLQFNWNELVWKDYVAPKVDTGAQMVRKRGERYLVNKANSPLNGRILIWRGDDSNIIVDYTAYYIDANNIVRSKSNDTASTLQLFNGNGWGDDSTIRIKDGVGTFINLNGDTCLYGTSELAIPYGFTKNKARAGEQVAGVDL